MGIRVQAPSKPRVHRTFPARSMTLGPVTIPAECVDRRVVYIRNLTSRNRKAFLRVCHALSIIATAIPGHEDAYIVTGLDEATDDLCRTNLVRSWHWTDNMTAPRASTPAVTVDRDGIVTNSTCVKVNGVTPPQKRQLTMPKEQRRLVADPRHTSDCQAMKGGVAYIRTDRERLVICTDPVLPSGGRVLGIFKPTMSDQKLVNRAREMGYSTLSRKSTPVTLS